MLNLAELIDWRLESGHGEKRRPLRSASVVEAPALDQARVLEKRAPGGETRGVSRPEQLTTRTIDRVSSGCRHGIVFRLIALRERGDEAEKRYLCECAVTSLSLIHI